MLPCPLPTSFGSSRNFFIFRVSCAGSAARLHLVRDAEYLALADPRRRAVADAPPELAPQPHRQPVLPHDLDDDGAEFVQSPPVDQRVKDEVDRDQDVADRVDVVVVEGVDLEDVVEAVHHPAHAARQGDHREGSEYLIGVE